MELPLKELPEGWTLLEAVMVAKCLNEEGEVQLFHCATDGLNSWEALGMLIYTGDALRYALSGREDED